MVSPKLQLEREKYLAAVINLISFRPRSRGEIITYLTRRQASPKMIRVILGKLKRLGYIDDQRFAKLWLASRKKAKGIAALTAQLMAKGIDRETITAAIQELDLKNSELDSAKALLEKQLHKWQSLPALKRRQRAYGYLARRGFSSSIIEALVDKLPLGK